MQNSQSKFCKDCLHFKEGYRMDFCHSPKNGINEVSGDQRVGVVYFTRGLYCKGDWFEPKPVDKPKELKHNTFFQRIRKVWSAWKASKSQ